MNNDNLMFRRSEPGQKKIGRWTKSKSSLRSILRNYPQIEPVIIKIWHSTRYWFWRAKWKFETSIGGQRGVNDRSIDIDKIYYVNPQKITYTSQKEFRLRDYKGHILGGDWDNLDKQFDSLDIYHAIKQVCVEGKSWEETVFYQRILADMLLDKIHYGCRNKIDFLTHCRNIETLFSTIQKNGYQSQQELYLSGKLDDALIKEDEVAINIGRDGDLLFSDGAHRLTIAKLLGIPLIPVKIAVRHLNWIKFRDELTLYMRDNVSSHEKKLYQPITHIDLSDYPFSHEGNQRFQLILNNTSYRNGFVLDLGASLGYFCHRFEDIGFECVAVENDPQTIYFLKKLARAENRAFNIISASLLDSDEIRNTHFDIVLALNIFHHLIKSHQTFEMLADFLKHLDMEELFLEVHLQEEPQMERAYKNFSPHEFVEFILENSVLEEAELIGEVQNGRPIYKLFHRKY